MDAGIYANILPLEKQAAYCHIAFMDDLRRAYMQDAEETLLQRRKQGLPREEIPVKSVVLGIVLLVIGLVFFTVCYLHIHGHTKQHIKEGSVSRTPDVLRLLLRVLHLLAMEYLVGS